MRIRDAAALARLLVAIRGIWNGFEKITPKMVTDTLKLLYTFFTGKVAILFLVALVGCQKPIEPTRVLSIPVKVTPAPRPERTLIVPTPAPAPRPIPAPAPIRVVARPAVWITAQTASNNWDRGSGTLIKPDEVITCWHLFTRVRGPLEVHFSDGQTVTATVVRKSETQDLALLKLSHPVDVPPAKLSDTKDYDTLTAKGYGGLNDGYREVTGPFVDWTSKERDGPDYTVVFKGVTVPGDSGAGVYNSDGLYAVLWGNLQGNVHATGGRALREFLAGTLRTPVQAAAHGGRLVVVSLPFHICAPCRVMGSVVSQLRAYGYDAQDVQLSDYNGGESTGPYPTLLFYSGDKLVLKTVGAKSYNEVAAKLDSI